MNKMEIEPLRLGIHFLQNKDNKVKYPKIYEECLRQFIEIKNNDSQYKKLIKTGSNDIILEDDFIINNRKNNDKVLTLNEIEEKYHLFPDCFLELRLSYLNREYYPTVKKIKILEELTKK